MKTSVPSMVAWMDPQRRIVMFKNPGPRGPGPETVIRPHINYSWAPV